MAQALILSGSPRKGGNTDDCVAFVAQRLAEAGHVAEAIRIYEQRIEPCRGCRACMVQKRCAISGDDFEALWGRIRGADLLVLAAPVYWMGPPGGMKDLVDRTHGYYALGRPLSGLGAALLSVAGDEGCWGPHEGVLSSWLRVYGATMLDPVRILAREKGEAMASPAALRKLERWSEKLLAELG